MFFSRLTPEHLLYRCSHNVQVLVPTSHRAAILRPRGIIFLRGLPPQSLMGTSSPAGRWWVRSFPVPVPNHCHQPYVSLRAVPSALGVCHLLGGAAGGVPPERGCHCKCGFASVVVAFLWRLGEVAVGWVGGLGSVLLPGGLQHPHPGGTGRSWDFSVRLAVGNKKFVPTSLSTPMPNEQLPRVSGDPQDGDTRGWMDGETPLRGVGGRMEPGRRGVSSPETISRLRSPCIAAP